MLSHFEPLKLYFDYKLNFIVRKLQQTCALPNRENQITYDIIYVKRLGKAVAIRKLKELSSIEERVFPG